MTEDSPAVDRDLLAAIAAEFPNADTEEVAAIAVAISTHVSDQAAAVAAGSDDEAEPDWTDGQWEFAGRIESTQRRTVRVLPSAPGDPWAAAGRTERM